MYNKFLASYRDPEGDYKEWAENSYEAFLSMANALELDLPEDMPDGTRCPKLFNAWFSDFVAEHWVYYIG